MPEQPLTVVFSRRVAPEVMFQVVEEFRQRSARESIRIRKSEGRLDEGAVYFYLRAASRLSEPPFSLMEHWLRESARKVDPNLVIPKGENFYFWIRPSHAPLPFL